MARLRKILNIPARYSKEPEAIEYYLENALGECGQAIIDKWLKEKGGISIASIPDIFHDTCSYSIDIDTDAISDVSHSATATSDSRINELEDKVSTLEKDLRSALNRIDSLEAIILREYTLPTDYN